MMSVRDGLEIQSLGIANSDYWRLDLQPFSIKKVKASKSSMFSREPGHENEELLQDSIRAVHENPEIIDPNQFAREIA